MFSPPVYPGIDTCIQIYIYIYIYVCVCIHMCDVRIHTYFVQGRFCFLGFKTLPERAKDSPALTLTCVEFPWVLSGVFVIRVENDCLP